MSFDNEPFSINDMPDNILVDIFSHLHDREKIKISGVCRRWGKVTKDKYLWRKVNFSPYFVPKLTFSKLAKRHLNDLTAELKICGNWNRSSPKSGYVASNNVFNIITKSSPKLKKLEIEDENLEECNLQLLPKYLKHLSFASCEIPVKSFTNFSDSFKYLDTLIFRGCPCLTDKHLSCLGIIPTLKRLECYGSYRLDNDAVNVICRNFTNLRTLVMIGCPYCSDDSCTKIFYSLKKLHEIEIEEWVNLTMAGVDRLKQLKSVRFLSVKCKQIKDGRLIIEGSRLH